MYQCRILDIFDNHSSSIVTLSDATLRFPIFSEEPLNLFNALSSPFEVFNTVTDIKNFERTPFSSCYRRIRLTRGLDPCIRSLCDEVSSLELDLQGVSGRRKLTEADRKCTWKAEIKCPEKKAFGRKYEWKAKIKHGVERKSTWMAEIENCFDRKYNWTVEIRGKNEEGEAVKKHHKYTSDLRWKKHHRIKEPKSYVERSIAGALEVEKKKGASCVRLVEIEEPVDRRTEFRRQTFDKRQRFLAKVRGKKKELTPQDAAVMIQRSFKEHLIRRSQVLRSLRELAEAKARLKEIRALFNNFSCRRQISSDAKERQRFSEKIIVPVLTVNAIEGADFMVRGAKKSMLNELEAMLDVVDPQPPGKLGLLKWKKFGSGRSLICLQVAFKMKLHQAWQRWFKCLIKQKSMTMPLLKFVCEDL